MGGVGPLGDPTADHLGGFSKLCHQLGSGGSLTDNELLKSREFNQREGLQRSYGSLTTRRRLDEERAFRPRLGRWRMHRLTARLVAGIVPLLAYWGPEKCSRSKRPVGVG